MKKIKFASFFTSSVLQLLALSFSANSFAYEANIPVSLSSAQCHTIKERINAYDSFANEVYLELDKLDSENPSQSPDFVSKIEFARKYLDSVKIKINSLKSQHRSQCQHTYLSKN